MHRETWRSDDFSTFHGIALVNDLGGVCTLAAKQSRTGTLVGTIIVPILDISGPTEYQYN